MHNFLNISQVLVNPPNPLNQIKGGFYSLRNEFIKMKLNARKLIVNSYEQKVACRAILAEYKF